jgi:SAM-dependent methyltransferase
MTSAEPPAGLDALPLRCPVCGQGLRRRGASLTCSARHTFDIARHGYVNLAAGRALVGDTAAMVAERHTFLAAGHYRLLADRIAELAADVLPAGGGLVVDAGGGTGHYLAHVLERAPPARGLVIDSSAAALRRAARSHPRAAAVGWNVWEPWPLPDGSVDLVLDVFAPRNPEEFHRVLRPHGALLVVTPAPEHLAEVRAVARLIDVDERKPERLAHALGARFRTEASTTLTFPMRLDAAGLRQVVGMGPSAHHDKLDGPRFVAGELAVTAAFVLTVYRRTTT